MTSAHAKPSITLIRRLSCAFTLGVLAASPGTIAQAVQSSPSAGESFDSPSLLEPSGRGGQLLASDVFRQQTYNRPSWGAPGWSRGGAARGGCNVNDLPLVPLVPLSGEEADDLAFLGITAAAAPDMLVYVPTTQAQAIELLVMDPNLDREQPGEVVYQQQQSVSTTPGILKFDLAAAGAELAPNRDYLWMFSIMCDPLDPSGNPYVRGLIKRVDTEPEVAAMGDGTDPYDRINAYAEAGLWYETLANVGDLYCDRPNDAEVAQDWEDLLFSMNLTRSPELLEKVQSDQLAAAPLLFCAE
jgi:hypothetical protein